MKERYKSRLCHWTETVSARLQLLEFRRDHAASLKEGIAFKRKLWLSVKRNTVCFRSHWEADPSLRLEAYRSQEAGLAAKCRLLEMESRVRGEKQ